MTPVHERPTLRLVNALCHYCQKRVGVTGPDELVPKVVGLTEAALVLMRRRFLEHLDAGTRCPGSGQCLAVARGREA